MRMNGSTRIVHSINETEQRLVQTKILSWKTSHRPMILLPKLRYRKRKVGPGHAIIINAVGIPSFVREGGNIRGCEIAFDKKSA